jgi:hypothetical protein
MSAVPIDPESPEIYPAAVAAGVRSAWKSTAAVRLPAVRAHCQTLAEAGLP